MSLYDSDLSNAEWERIQPLAAPENLWGSERLTCALC